METITDLNTETVKRVKKLVRMNLDASKGFEDAAARSENASHANTFRAASSERTQFATQLSAALDLSDEDVPESGTALGMFHRAWLNVRGAVTGGDGEQVLAEAIRGESALLDEYEEVLVETAGSPLNATLQEQVTAVRRTRDGLEQLK